MKDLTRENSQHLKRMYRRRRRLLRLAYVVGSQLLYSMQGPQISPLTPRDCSMMDFLLLRCDVLASMSRIYKAAFSSSTSLT